MSDPMSGPRTYGIVANDVLINAHFLFKDKLDEKINLVHKWPPLYSALYVFVCFMLSLLFAHATTMCVNDSCTLGLLMLYFHFFMVWATSLFLGFVFNILLRAGNDGFGISI